MRYILFIVVLVLSLSGCGKQQKKAPTSVALPPPPPVGANFVKAALNRPAGIPEKLETTNGCQVDWVNNVPARELLIVTDKVKVRFVGWAGNVVKGTVPQEVYVVLNGPRQVYCKGTMGMPRPDVVEAYKMPGLENSGWEAFADLSGLGSGTYSMTVAQIDKNSGSICDTQRTIVLP